MAYRGAGRRVANGAGKNRVPLSCARSSPGAGPGFAGKPVRFKVRLNGAQPGADHGADVSSEGKGIVQDRRLYQLIRQTGRVADETFEIEFLDPGVQAFAFTFG